MQKLWKIQPNLYLCWLDSEFQRDNFHASSLWRFRVALNETTFSKRIVRDISIVKFFDLVQQRN